MRYVTRDQYFNHQDAVSVKLQSSLSSWLDDN